MVRPRRSLQGGNNQTADSSKPSKPAAEESAGEAAKTTITVGAASKKAGTGGAKEVKRKRNSEVSASDDKNATESQEEGGGGGSSQAAASKNDSVPVVNEAIEPRKRRLASLNAEFLVHYCSTATSHAPQQPSSNNASETPAPTPLVGSEENQESKRRRTVSQDSAGRSKKMAEECKPLRKPSDKEQTTTTGARAKRKQAEEKQAKSKTSNAKESDAGSVNNSTSKAHDESSAVIEEEAVATTAGGKKSKSARQPTARHADDDEEMEVNGEAASAANDHHESEEKAATTPAKSRTPKGRPSRASKAAAAAASAVKDEDETPAPAVSAGRPRREASMRASAMIIQTNEIEKTRFQYYSSATTTPSTMFTTTTAAAASAANGKQTARSNSRSKTSPASAAADHSLTKGAKVVDSLNSSKVSAAGEFQVPHPPLPAANTARKNNNNTSSASLTPELTEAHRVTKHTKRQNSASDLSAKVKFQLGASSPHNQSSSNMSPAAAIGGIQSPSVLTSIGGGGGGPSSLRQISTTTTLASSMLPGTSTGVNCNGADLMNAGDPDDEDNDSSDVLIVMERAGTGAGAVAINGTTGAKGAGARAKLNNSNNERPLTEEVLAEHNKINGTISSSGGGTFSNYTRDYITKWALDYKPSNDKPFSPGIIPIESFGIKVIQEPQYVAGKPTKQTYHLITTKPDKSISPSIEASVVPTTNAASFPPTTTTTTTATTASKPPAQLQQQSSGGVIKGAIKTSPSAIQVAAKATEASNNNSQTSTTPNGGGGGAKPPASSSTQQAAATQVNLNGVAKDCSAAAVQSLSNEQSMLTAAAAVASSAALTNVLSHNTALNNLAAALNLSLQQQQQQSNRLQQIQQQQQQQQGLVVHNSKQQLHSQAEFVMHAASDLVGHQYLSLANTVLHQYPAAAMLDQHGAAALWNSPVPSNQALVTANGGSCLMLKQQQQQQHQVNLMDKQAAAAAAALSSFPALAAYAAQNSQKGKAVAAHHPALGFSHQQVMDFATASQQLIADDVSSLYAASRLDQMVGKGGVGDPTTLSVSMPQPANPHLILGADERHFYAGGGDPRSNAADAAAFIQSRCGGQAVKYEPASCPCAVDHGHQTSAGQPAAKSVAAAAAAAFNLALNLAAKSSSHSHHHQAATSQHQSIATMNQKAEASVDVLNGTKKSSGGRSANRLTKKSASQADMSKNSSNSNIDVSFEAEIKKEPVATGRQTKNGGGHKQANSSIAKANGEQSNGGATTVKCRFKSQEMMDVDDKSVLSLNSSSSSLSGGHQEKAKKSAKEASAAATTCHTTSNNSNGGAAVTKSSNKNNTNSIMIQNDSLSLSCSCRIKLDPECMTITINAKKDNSSVEAANSNNNNNNNNNNSSHHTPEQNNVQNHHHHHHHHHYNVVEDQDGGSAKQGAKKQASAEPAVTASKMEIEQAAEDNEDEDDDDDSSSSVHLVVDETSLVQDNTIESEKRAEEPAPKPEENDDKPAEEATTSSVPKADSTGPDSNSTEIVTTSADFKMTATTNSSNEDMQSSSLAENPTDNCEAAPRKADESQTPPPSLSKTTTAQAWSVNAFSGGVEAESTAAAAAAESACSSIINNETKLIVGLTDLVQLDSSKLSSLDLEKLIPSQISNLSEYSSSDASADASCTIDNDKALAPSAPLFARVSSISVQTKKDDDAGEEKLTLQVEWFVRPEKLRNCLLKAYEGFQFDADRELVLLKNRTESVQVDCIKKKWGSIREKRSSGASPTAPDDPSQPPVSQSPEHDFFYRFEIDGSKLVQLK